MINGDVTEFVDRIHYGDELWFLYRGKKYFLEGWLEKSTLKLFLYDMTDNNGDQYTWLGDEKNYPVEQFLIAPIWDGKTFWEVQEQMEWIDC